MNDTSVIDKSKAQNRQAYNSIIGFLAFFGISITAMVLTVIVSAIPDTSWVKTEGVVVGTQLGEPRSDNNQRALNLIIEYKVDGVTYTLSTPKLSPGDPEIGSKRPLRYNTANPSESVPVMTSMDMAQTIFTMIMLSILAIMMLVGAWRLYKLRHDREATAARLLSINHKVQGTVVDISYPNLLSFTLPRNKATGSITVSAPDANGVLTQYNTGVMNTFPYSHLDFRTQKVMVDVYINPAEPQDYYIDTSMLPKGTPAVNKP